MLSSDVDLITYGVAKNVTAWQLSKFVQGVDLLDCTQLTKLEVARSLAFKVTIKPNDFGKCMNAEIWPYGVGLRRFKHFTPRQSSLLEDRPKSSNYIDDQDHRIRDNELRPQNHIGIRDNRFRNVRFEEDALIARNAYSIFHFLNIMEGTYTTICIYSFNSRGFGDDKQDICRLLV